MAALVRPAAWVHLGVWARWLAPWPLAVLQKFVCSLELQPLAEPVYLRAAQTALPDELASEPLLVQRASRRRAHLQAREPAP